MQTERDDVIIRHGKQENLPYSWKEIIEQPNEQEMQKRIDEMLDMLNANSPQNGFIGEDEVVDCGQLRGFYLNDRTIYYMFFDNLKKLYDFNKDKQISDGKYFDSAIKSTIKQYAGGTGINREERFKCTNNIITDDGDLSFPSISEQKGKNCFYCTERAAISHNLWVLAGASSYFCWTSSDDFGKVDDECKSDTHNFTIVESKGKFVLYDLAMNNFCMLPDSCINDMLEKKGLKVENVENPGIYVKSLETERTQDI